LTSLSLARAVESLRIPSRVRAEVKVLICLLLLSLKYKIHLKTAESQNTRALEAQNWSRRESRTLTIEAWRHKMESWRVCRLGVADCHHFDENPDPH
jgi:hypothetical protein